MTGDCHVRFCERLRGETPLCLLGERKEKKIQETRSKSLLTVRSLCVSAPLRLCERKEEKIQEPRD